jgi:hypothetical protein
MMSVIGFLAERVDWTHGMCVYVSMCVYVCVCVYVNSLRALLLAKVLWELRRHTVYLTCAQRAYAGALKGFASGLGAVGVALVVGAAIQVSVVYLTCT